MFDINTFWFSLIAILFAGFFFLEGFDYGVGMLLPFIARKDKERRMVMNSIGHVWDGNEVWMIGAGGAIFAAFPNWYATMFSGFYMALLLILFGLALRGVSFEFRGKSKYRSWRRFWDFIFFLGSFLLAFLWGVFVGNLIRGIPIGPEMHYLGTFWGLLNIYSLVSGVMFVLLFALHGGAYLRLKMPVDHRVSLRLNSKLPIIHKITVILVLFFVILTCFERSILTDPPALIIALISFICLLLAGIGIDRSTKLTFIFTALTVILLTFCVFVLNYPNCLLSTINSEWSLTIYNSCSSDYSLKVMRVVALIFVPIILIYQILAYWLFRKRITEKDLEY